tara:strand:- start:5238 stop:6749 length:1512 start_codon:yes stop_codon:yes gene_type:complete
MSSEHLASAKNHLKGDLGGSWNILDGASGQYTDLGIARRFGGSAAAYSLRDIGAMNGRVVKVRREQDTTPVDFSAGAIASGGIEQFAIGQSVLDKYNDAAYFPADSAYFSITNIALTGAFTITVSFIYTGNEDKDEMTLFFGNAGRDTITFTDYGTFRFRRDADNKTIALDSDIKKNTLHTLVVTRDSSDVVSISIDGVTQSNTVTEAGTYNIERLGFRNRGTEFDININGVAAYTGGGADASNWTDTIGSNDATKVGSPAAFTGQGISAFVDTWYDQSGNGRDASQSTSSSQPFILKDGSLITLQGKPSIDFADRGSASAMGLVTTYDISSDGNLTEYSVLSVFDGVNLTNTGTIVSSGAVISGSATYGGFVHFINSSGNGGFITARNQTNGASAFSSSTPRAGFQNGTGFRIMSTYYKSTSFLTELYGFTSGSNADDTSSPVKPQANSSTNGRLAIGTSKTFEFRDAFNGLISEVIAFTSDKRDDNTEFKNDLTNYYGTPS